MADLLSCIDLKKILEILIYFKNVGIYMLQSKIIKSVLKNLNNLMSILEDDIENYYFSIYSHNGVIRKKLPFIEIFDLNNSEPYGLNELEAEILRNYIGLYDDGKQQEKSDICKQFEISDDILAQHIHSIISKLCETTCQERIIKERNNLIRTNINNQKLKEKILNEDIISFLDITIGVSWNLCVKNRFRTVGDLLSITYQDIITLNVLGTFKNIVIFPRYIVEQIHELGLRFEFEMIFEEMFRYDELLADEYSGINILKGITTGVNTISDLLSMLQFDQKLLQKIQTHSAWKATKTDIYSFISMKLGISVDDMIYFDERLEQINTEEMDEKSELLTHDRLSQEQIYQMLRAGIQKYNCKDIELLEFILFDDDCSEEEREIIKSAKIRLYEELNIQNGYMKKYNK